MNPMKAAQGMRIAAQKGEANVEDRIIFREMLTELKAAADRADGVLTRASVRETLKDMPLEEEHYQLIYDYLAEQGIRVVESNDGGKTESSALNGGGITHQEDVRRADADLEQEEETIPELERSGLSFYLDEIAALADGSNADEIRLVERVRGGDASAKERLVELYLPMICTMAEEYGEETIPSEDLIQEGNMGLLDAMASLETLESAAACRVHILNSIREAMENAVRRGQDQGRMDDGLVSRLNHLNEAVHNLERDLGRKVSAEEVSAYLEMPEEEIEDLLRVAGDQIETDAG
ncbi:MAG: hypothetical protein LUI13_06255 [Lachnospiraceae bacterium]|nr:hypothetical protein [Lachnospiraceae bacterium]